MQIIGREDADRAGTLALEHLVEVVVGARTAGGVGPQRSRDALRLLARAALDRGNLHARNGFERRKMRAFADRAGAGNRDLDHLDYAARRRCLRSGAVASNSQLRYGREPAATGIAITSGTS